MPQRQSRPLGLTLIAIGKLLKATLLIAFGVAALAIVGKDGPSTVDGWAEALRVDPSSRLLHRAIEAVSGVSAKKLEGLGVGSFVYAALFAVEAIGLWLQKRWAEYLTIAITISFVPFEIYEIARHATAARIVTLALNVVAVVYLVVRVVHHRRERGGARSPSATQPSPAE
jgi:uncharacterized membrane protein (DUF2068 family)